MVIAVSQVDNPRRYSTKTFQIRVDTSPSVDVFQIKSFVPPGEEELESLGIVSDPNGIPYKLEIIENTELETFLTAFTTGKLFSRLSAVIIKEHNVKTMASRIYLEN